MPLDRSHFEQTEFPFAAYPDPIKMSGSDICKDAYISRTFLGRTVNQTFDDWLNDAHRKGWMLVSHTFDAYQRKHCVFINMRRM